MQSKIIVTADNSKTLLIPEMNETYHSTRGAITEARHVFIKEGLHYIDRVEINIFEMGFGTGLNALITLNESKAMNLKVVYHAIESHPLDLKTILEMDYLSELKLVHLKEPYLVMHNTLHETLSEINPCFSFRKYISTIQDQQLENEKFDLIYYDAFGPKVQPELWEPPVLQKMYNALKPGGILVTYCAQGQFRRNLKQLGFKVEKLPGPPGKREMTRALK